MNSYLDSYEDAVDYYDSIDRLNFFENSKTNFVMSKTGTREVVSAMVRAGDFAKTHFRFLPIEIIEFIFEMAAKLMERDEYTFYTKYFSKEQNERKILRQLRVRPGVPDVSGTRYKEFMTPIGTINCRNIYLENAVEKCNNAFSSVVERGLKTIKDIRHMKKTMEKWFVWVCDHTYLNHWFRFMQVFTKKVYEIEETLWELQNGTLTLSNFSTPEEIAELEYLINSMKYFVEDYVPYALLTRSKAYFDTLTRSTNQSEYNENTFGEMLFELFKITGRHPNDIDLEQAYEFEIRTYAPDYYYDSYLNYMTTRSGKRLFPGGKKPVFYWRGDNYVCTFV